MKKALGRGLEALIPATGEEVIHVNIEKIFPNPDQPRKVFDEKALGELAQSIREKGIIQPIIVNREGDGTFRLIAGERRWRASAMAGLKKIPSLIRDEATHESLEIALIENIQRENLNPLETAEAFKRLIEEFNLTQEELSQKVGKDRATVSNYMRILNLPAEAKSYINEGRISMGHAKALLSLGEAKDIMTILRKIVRNDLSVRDTEKMCRKKSEVPRGKTIIKKDPQIALLEDELIKHLGTKVSILHREKGGKIEIEYYSLDELNRLLDILRC